MKISTISEDDLFDDQALDALTEAILDPQWSEPLELSEFLTQLEKDLDAIENQKNRHI